MGRGGAHRRPRGAPTQPPPPPPPPRPPRQHKGDIHLEGADLRTELYRLLGVDAPEIPGLGSNSVAGLVMHLGTDLAAFPKVACFTNWQGLCPNPQVSGGRVLKRGTRDVKNPVATIFRLAAQSLHHSDSFLGAYYRRMRAKLGAPKAITATAHKLARIYYHLVTTQQAYDESVFAKNEEREAQRRVRRRKAGADPPGFVLSPAVAAA